MRELATRPAVRVDGRWLVHALPFLADILYLAQVFYGKSGAEKVALALVASSGPASASFYAMTAVEVVQALAYLLLSWRALEEYGRKIRGYFSDLTRIDLRWPESARQSFGVDAGLESAFIARATYAHRVDLGFSPDARLFARATLPVVTPFSATGMGVGGTVLIGYEGDRWTRSTRRSAPRTPSDSRDGGLAKCDGFAFREGANRDSQPGWPFCEPCAAAPTLQHQETCRSETNIRSEWKNTLRCGTRASKR